MQYLHTMLRVLDLELSLKFYRDALGLKVFSRKEYPAGRFTLVYLAAPNDNQPQIELTYNWEQDTAYSTGRNFGHVAFAVDDIYAICEHLQQHGITINRPPHDGQMAFVRSPDGISIELLQRAASKPIVEPWASMPNVGEW